MQYFPRVKEIISFLSAPLDIFDKTCPLGYFMKQKRFVFVNQSGIKLARNLPDYTLAVYLQLSVSLKIARQ